MKIVFYVVFAFFFYIYRLFPINNNKIMYIMTHDKALDGNIGFVYKELQKKRHLKSNFIRREDSTLSLSPSGIQRILNFFIVKSYHLATSKYIFLDNVFLPAAYIKFHPSVKNVQLWHGCGAIKKFGQDVNTGLLAIQEKRANYTYTNLIVNSSSTIEQYTTAFGIPKDKILPLGSPRTDFFFDNKRAGESKQQFYKEHPDLVGKKIILYAPTFRDYELNKPQVHIDFQKFFEKINQDLDYVILLRLHPFVSSKYKHDKSAGRVHNFSHYHDLNTLLLISDILVTDYSSIIFEYSLLCKPMIFYPYDLDKYEKTIRGFYWNYKEDVPGPIAYNTDQLIETINNNDWDLERIEKFKNDNFDHTDGKSTQRLIRHVFKG